MVFSMLLITRCYQYVDSPNVFLVLRVYLSQEVKFPSGVPTPVQPVSRALFSITLHFRTVDYHMQEWSDVTCQAWSLHCTYRINFKSSFQRIRFCFLLLSFFVLFCCRSISWSDPAIAFLEFSSHPPSRVLLSSCEKRRGRAFYFLYVNLSTAWRSVPYRTTMASGHC